jgi:hypothetical protein
VTPSLLAIVPFRGWQEGRVEGARHVVQALRRASAKVVVVEQDTEHVELGADVYLQLADRGPFNRSACFNAGVRAQPALGDRQPLLFTDCDILCPPEALDAALAGLERVDAVSPYDALVDLTQEASAALYRGEPPGDGERRTGINLTGGAVLMTHWAHRECGGWDEQMVGWGGEDDLMSNKIVKLGVRHSFLRFTAHHLWHGRGPPDPQAGARYRQNLARLDRVFRMSAAELRAEVSLNQSSVNRWKSLHEGIEGVRPYGDVLTYEKGAAFLKGLPVEDWGCGLGWFRRCFEGPYTGLDGSPSRFADAIVDLCRHRSKTPGLFMRHVLEHNQDWQAILRNAIASFTRRMVLVLFTPFAETTRVLRNPEYAPGVSIPDISFARADLVREFGHLLAGEESLSTATQYGVEHVFYLEKA